MYTHGSGWESLLFVSTLKMAVEWQGQPGTVVEGEEEY